MYAYNLLFLASVTTTLVVTVVLVGEVVGSTVESIEFRTLRWWADWPGFQLSADSLAFDWKVTPRAEALWATGADIEPLPPGLEVVDLDAVAASEAFDAPGPWRIDGAAVAAGTSFRR